MEAEYTKIKFPKEGISPQIGLRVGHRDYMGTIRKLFPSSGLILVKWDNLKTEKHEYVDMINPLVEGGHYFIEK